jgi:hypothetical protein
MNIHRRIAPIITLLAAAALAAPAAGSANSLLSGYGGPGQGSQAILGSALLNGPGNGGGPRDRGPSDSGGNVAISAAPGGGLLSGSSGDKIPAGGPGQRGQRTAGSHSSGGARGRAGGAAAGTSGAYAAPEGRSAAQSSTVLGLSSGDLLDVVVALVALAFTAMLTRRLRPTNTANRHA